eukprot:1658893-Rhodomonas_salina.4
MMMTMMMMMMMSDSERCGGLGGRAPESKLKPVKGMSMLRLTESGCDGGAESLRGEPPTRGTLRHAEARTSLAQRTRSASLLLDP